VQIRDETDLSKLNIQQLKVLNPVIDQAKQAEAQNEKHIVLRRKFFETMKDEALKKDIIRKDMLLAKQWKNKIKF
jgi:hypothetical protein